MGVQSLPIVFVTASLAGIVFGTTNGKGTSNVAFCYECHMGVAEQDSLFFLPVEFRVSGN